MKVREKITNHIVHFDSNSAINSNITNKPHLDNEWCNVTKQIEDLEFMLSNKTTDFSHAIIDRPA